jgi:hypothetical protein
MKTHLAHHMSLSELLDDVGRDSRIVHIYHDQVASPRLRLSRSNRTQPRVDSKGMHVCLQYRSCRSFFSIDNSTTEIFWSDMGIDRNVGRVALVCCDGEVEGTPLPVQTLSPTVAFKNTRQSSCDGESTISCVRQAREDKDPVFLTPGPFLQMSVKCPSPPVRNSGTICAWTWRECLCHGFSMTRPIVEQREHTPIPSSFTAQVISTFSGISLQLQEILIVEGLVAMAGLVNSTAE